MRGLIQLGMFIAAGLGSPSPPVLVPTALPVAESIRPLLKTYCFDCHADGMDKGGVALDDLLNADPTASRPGWQKVWKIVRQEFMPPARAERPTDQERRALTHWVQQEIFRIDDRHPDPGRVAIRRLNRVEYNHSINDLFGVSLPLEGKMPPDDTAFGFDNMAEAQTLSPSLLDTYFGLAEEVVGQVIALHGPMPRRLVLNKNDLVVAHPPGSVRAEHTLPFATSRPGKYQLDINFPLGGWREFGGSYLLNISVDGAALKSDDLKLGGERKQTYSLVLNLRAGSHKLLLTTTPGPVKSTGGSAPTSLNLAPAVELVGPLDRASWVYAEPHRRIFFQGDAPSAMPARKRYAAALIKRLADRAFRRPADTTTVQRLVGIIMAERSFEKGVALAATAILTSPRFLFREEPEVVVASPGAAAPGAAPSIAPIDDYALATRLSYFLWLSLPDAELTRLAAHHQLRAQLDSQVKRMLADPRSSRFFEDFPGQWLRTRNVLYTAVATIEEQKKVDGLRAGMKKETEMLFEHIARQDRDLVELLTADYSFLNEGLATFYGVAGVKGPVMRKVTFAPENHRGGILTQGSFLLATSNPNRTSPVKRGLFVLDALLGVQPPPPPPNVPSLDDAKKSGQATPLTLREQLAIHREKKACAACHDHFDPIGIALENYDHLGRWRDKEAGTAIDPSATMVTGERLSGVDDLRRVVAARKDRFYRCLTEKLLTYALGRALEIEDAVTVDQITGQVAAAQGKFSTLLLAVVNSAPFQMRRAQPPEAVQLVSGAAAAAAKEPVSPPRNVPGSGLPERRLSDGRATDRRPSE